MNIVFCLGAFFIGVCLGVLAAMALSPSPSDSVKIPINIKKKGNGKKKLAYLHERYVERTRKGKK